MIVNVRTAVFSQKMYQKRFRPSSGVGCHTGSVFVAALAYADDIVIMAPSASAMRYMLASWVGLRYVVQR
jgi:hypothetical protein